MSTQVFPAIASGPSFSITRTPIFNSRKPRSISMKETSIADTTYPRYQWDLVFNVLRQGAIGTTNFTEFQTLFGFYNLRSGGYDSFLYQDENDNAVVGQGLGVSNGSQLIYPLAAAFGGFTQPILAPNLSITPTVYENGSPISTSSYSITPWGTTNAAGPGQLILGSSPTTGVTISIDFSYYFPCRFVKDQYPFEKFDSLRYKLKGISFMSIK